MWKKWLSLGLIIALLIVPQPGIWGVAPVYADPPPPPAPPPPPPAATEVAYQVGGCCRCGRHGSPRAPERLTVEDRVFSHVLYAYMAHEHEERPYQNKCGDWLMKGVTHDYTASNSVGCLCQRY